MIMIPLPRSLIPVQVAIKTMKKTFESFSQCLELREVVFLKTLPSHPHLVPAYDIFLDPLSKKLHIAMENMDGNLYQLMKTRDHKPFDGNTVKSILFQILSGLEHIHDNGFFHRDIKPENILVSSSAPDSTSAFKRYSSLVTPPSTPPTYTIKLADFGLARETQSIVPYTTYVSTRWYRAPEVLLRAGQYSAPVDIWALGAMAVEIATLKPLFPGGNEVDQVWRVCEIMGSPGVWINKHNQKLGGGEWKDGVRLAGKLGFSFPKMAPHSMDSILQTPQWPASLSHFVTWCLMWDPAARPTSAQALAHEYFADAVDPLRPKSSSRFLSRKSSTLSSIHDSPGSDRSLSTKKSSWFRKSIATQDFTPPAVSQHHITSNPQQQQQQQSSIRPPVVHSNTTSPAGSIKVRPSITKRATAPGINIAPIPILPSAKPVSPIHDAVHAQASGGNQTAEKPKRQASVNAHGANHYADYHRDQAERALNGSGELASPTGMLKESFFSHLRKRARRFSGRNQVPHSPTADDVEASVGCTPWATGRASMSLDPPAVPSNNPSIDGNLSELDKALESVRNSLDASASAYPSRQVQRTASNPILKRHHSVAGTPSQAPTVVAPARTRRSVRHSINPMPRYETPDEEEELLDEALSNASQAARGVAKGNDQPQVKISKPTHIDIAGKDNVRPSLAHVTSDPGPYPVPYLTPSPSKELTGMNFGQHDTPMTSNPIDIPSHPAPQPTANAQWPTPPYEESEWAKRVAQDLAAHADAAFR